MVNNKKKQRNLGNIATRSVSSHYFDLVPPEGAFKVSKRFGMGGKIHGKQNWRTGDWRFICATINHLEQHFHKFKSHGNVLDDNIGAILWAGYALAWFEENKPKEWKRAMYFISYDGDITKHSLFKTYEEK